MITEEMLRQWSTRTLREALTASPFNEPINWQEPPDGKAEKTRFIKHLRNLRRTPSDLKDGVLDTPMTGGLSQGWRDLNRDTIFFQDCLAAVHRAYPEKWTPADYLLQCYISAKQKGVVLEEMDLGRALRNLPSFMREYLIAGMLAQLDGVDIEIPSETMNAKYHVDLILKTNGKIIYVWSYLSSAHAIRRLTENKLSGERGKILKGYNLLAPFDKAQDAITFHSWWVPSAAYIDQLLLSVVGSHITYQALLMSIKKPASEFESVLTRNLIFEM